MERIDAVITYVDMSDPEWQSVYNDYVLTHDLPNREINSEIRFREYGALKACLRSIAKYGSWINKVYLVVQSESQVPSWINRNEVSIVYHKDIIPEQYLPTFNSNVIELHVHRIKGLSEKFILFNDDMLFVNNNDPMDYFIGNKCVHYIYSIANVKSNNSDDFYRRKRYTSLKILKDLGYNVDLQKVFYNCHGPLPLLKSEQELLYSKINVDSHISAFREVYNTSPELFTLFMKCRRKLVLLENASNRNKVCYYNTEGNYTINSHLHLKQNLLCDNSGGLYTYCINDVFKHENIKDMSFVLKEVEQILKLRFPDQCKYETNNIPQTIPEAGSEGSTSI